MAELRTPPHSSEAEQSLLGALLMDNGAWDKVADVLTAEHLYHSDHCTIFSAIGRLVSSNKVADVLTVYEAGAGDLQYLNSLVQATPSWRGVRNWAELIVGHWQARQAVAIGDGLAVDALRGSADGKEVPEIIDGAVQALLKLGERRAEREPRDVADMMVAYLDRINALCESTGSGDTMPTGLADLDRLTAGGGRRGELWVVGARPSMGKTAFTGQVSRKVAGSHGALFISMEDSEAALMGRQVAAVGGINLADLRAPKGAPQDMWPKLVDATDELRRLALFMDDQGGLTLADVRRKVQQTKRRHKGLGLVVVDYLQLMSGEGANRNIVLGAIANGMKNMAKEMDVWVILLSQLNREADKRPGLPHVSDLRDSGDIEGAADMVVLLHREFQRDNTADKHHMQANVAKHKNGATAVLDFFFDGSVQRISDWQGPIPSKLTRSAGRGVGAHGGGMD